MSTATEQRYYKLISAASKKIGQMQPVIDRLREPIAIIGIGCRFPKGNNIQEYWNLLKNGISGIEDRPKFHDYIDPYYGNAIYTKKGGFLEQHPAAFDASFFKISAMEAASMDPQHRLVLEVTWEALENAGIVPSKLAGSNTGVFMGICSNDYAWKLVKQNTENIDIYLGSGNAYSPVSGRVSYLLDIHGPSLAIDTACSSSLTSVHVAVNSIRTGECDIAIAGGIQRYLSPEYWVNLCKSRILSPDGKCKSFSEDANGYVRGEGCGIVILKRISQAKLDNNIIHAVIAGSATWQDGKTSGLTVPNGAAQQQAIRLALKNSNLDINDIDYIEAHGTGTPIGDPIEINALGNLFQKRQEQLLVGTVKSNIGHLEGSAGVAGLIKVVLSLKNKQIPQNLHFAKPSTKISWKDIPVKIVTQLTEWKTKINKKRTAGINSFGFEGVNTHVILQEYQRPVNIVKHKQLKNHFTITLSAKTKPALEAMIEQYINYIQSHKNLNIYDIAFSTNCKKEHYKERIAITCQSTDELLSKLQNAMQKKSFSHQGKINNKNVALLFTGQGSQYTAMGNELYNDQPFFRQTMEYCDQIILDKKLLTYSLLDVIYNKNNFNKLHTTMYTQPALFVIEYALARFLIHIGIEPTILLGHSIGEYVAACIANVFSLENALELVVMRAKLMQELPSNGTMLAVNLNENKASQLLKNEPLVSIAAINAQNSTVLSGDKDRLEKLIPSLKREATYVIPLQVSHAFHSPLMKPMLEKFRKYAKNIQYNEPEIPIISNITGDQITQLMDSNYWCQHILGTVQFYRGVLTLREHTNKIIEVGPDGILTRICTPYITGDKIVASIIQKNRNNWHTLMSLLSKLYSNSLKINWHNFYNKEDNHIPSLPTYPWQREHHWVTNE